MLGSSPLAVVGGILADIWDQRERGFAMPAFAGTLFAGKKPRKGCIPPDISRGGCLKHMLTIVTLQL